jgi:mono/diheme cytochrome c family protein
VKAKTAVLLLAMVFGLLVVGLVPSALGEGPSGRKDPGNAPVVPTHDTDSMRLQGEQRFRANCGRCHAAPRKFPPRMMATVLRHMRVRAAITDEDMRLVLFYMTQ